MIRSKLMSGIFALVMMVALHVWPGMVKTAHGQGTRKDDIVFNTRGVPLAGATVRICAMPATGHPCVPLALIYSDAALTQALPNPTTTDGLGNYFFYAAPGRYEIEISGPGIATEQLPNVILPSDRASPTFSTINSTRAINAFSLSLTGNLTVNGSTTVVGNLASGTLNLANQGTPTGAAGAGTVNLYTKTADKRLYYKDETGTEIGPIANASGAQTNVANTFTAPQNVDADFHMKGPNPSYDITRYGGYTGDNYNTPTTGNISGGSAALALGSALDFANAQGVLVLGAGPAPTIATPTGVTVAPLGMTGSTSYSYCVVDEDYTNGKTACSASGTTATGAASLGIQSVTITNRVRSGGVVTITTSTTHNFINGSQVNVTRAGDGSFEGAFTITSVPSGTTFTYNQYGAADFPSTATSGSAQVAAKALVKWNAPTGYKTLKHIIYRCTSSCGTVGPNYVLAGVAVGMDSSFVDYGFAITAANVDNGDVAATAPTRASNQWLSTTISSGGGTTRLTLAAAAATTVSGAKVFHDNTPIILGLCTTFLANGGGNIFVPAPASGSFPHFPINSTLNMGQTCPHQMEIDFGAFVWQSGTIIPRNGSLLKGIASGNAVQGAAGYTSRPTVWISGNAYPFLYMVPNFTSNNALEAMFLTCGQPYQPCIYQDEDPSGNGPTSIRYTDVFASGGSQSTAYVAKGGFGFFWERGSWETNATSFNSPPAALFTLNCGLGQTNQELPAILYADRMSIFGGMVLDSCGQPPAGSGGGNHMEFHEVLMENTYIPAFRANTVGGATIYAIDFYNLGYSDPLSGAATPLIDLTNVQLVTGLRLIHPLCANGVQPAFEVGTAGGAYFGLEILSTGCILNGTNNAFVRNASANADQYYNWLIQMNVGSKAVAGTLAAPPAPIVVVQAGGSIPTGNQTFTISQMDALGGETITSTGTTQNFTGGNQTAQITRPALSPFAAGWNIYQNNSLINAGGCVKPQFPASQRVVTYASSFGCGGTSPGITTAAQAGMGAGGVFGILKAEQITTISNCLVSGASPLACGNAPSGTVAVAVAATTVTVNTTAVTANSQINLTVDTSATKGGSLSPTVTCNTTPPSTAPYVSAISAGTSFTITIAPAPAGNPQCIGFTITN
jgi:hypothetical protein